MMRDSEKRSLGLSGGESRSSVVPVTTGRLRLSRGESRMGGSRLLTDSLPENKSRSVGRYHFSLTHGVL